MRTAMILLSGLIAFHPAASWAQAAPSGVLQAPAPGGARPSASATAPAPKAVPRGSVQQVAPYSSAPLAQPRPGSALGHSAPGATSRRPPVVVAPRQAQKAKPRGAMPTAAGAAAAAATAAAAAAAAIAADSPPPPPPPPPAERPDPNKGTATGQKLPRWASLRTDDVNLRTGPGTRYPVEWVYHRRDLPVQIEREFEVWRLIADQDGVKGWVHQATLTGRRSFMVKGKDQTLRRSAADDAGPVALLRAGVIGRIRACEATAAWCEVQTGDYRGWLRRDALWGMDADDAVAN
jgi:SH3-like domain-containing protein